MSHDGSPSPLYWVIWSVFQNFWTFPAFPGIPEVPVLLQMLPEGSSVIQMVSRGGLDVPGVFGSYWRSLDILGCGLNSSRSFGLRHMLAGHPCRRRVSKAHSWVKD